MIDDSDADFALLAGGNMGGWIGAIVLLLAVALYFIACQNKDECAQKHCDAGKPVLAHHQCVCEVLAE